MRASQQHNPFAPPATDEPAAPPWAGQAPSSVVPRVFGVLSIVFSSLLLLLMLVGVLGAGMTALRRAEAAPRVEAEQPTSAPVAGSTVRAERTPPRRPEPPAYTVLAVAVGLLFLLLTPALLVIGIGQLRYRRWALRATIVWSVLALVCLGCMIALGIVDPEPGSRPLIAVTSLVVFLAPYPILLLVFFTRPRVIAAMQAR